MGKNLHPSAAKCVQIPAHKNNTFLNTRKNLRPSAVKCVQILGTKNASGQMSLLNTNTGLAEILRTGFSPRPVIAALPQNAFPKVRAGTGFCRPGRDDDPERKDTGSLSVSVCACSAARSMAKTNGILPYIYIYIQPPAFSRFTCVHCST